MRSGLDDTMRIAYQSMREVWHSRDDVEDLRTAAYIVAIDRVAKQLSGQGPLISVRGGGWSAPPLKHHASGAEKDNGRPGCGRVSCRRTNDSGRPLNVAYRHRGRCAWPRPWPLLRKPRNKAASIRPMWLPRFRKRELGQGQRTRCAAGGCRQQPEPGPRTTMPRSR